MEPQARRTIQTVATEPLVVIQPFLTFLHLGQHSGLVEQILRQDLAEQVIQTGSAHLVQMGTLPLEEMADLRLKPSAVVIQMVPPPEAEEVVV